jgi:CheY-like chemotaxis protein
VRRILLECIEALKPEVRDLGRVEAARTYDILTSRYVDGLSIQEIAGELALSPSQVYREHTKGVEAVAAFLWDRIRERNRDSQPVLPIVQNAAEERLKMAQAEVNRLRQEVHTQSLNLRDVLEGIFNLLAPRTQRAGIQIKLSSPGTWPSMVADRVMLRQALLNLLSYALDTIAWGGMVITVTYGKSGLLIDTGESPAIAKTRSIPPPSPKRAGVGLAVAQALIEAQGGRLEINERAGKWQAQILLPTSGRTTLLVVDDNANLVALFKRYLGGHEVSVVGATDGEQALRLAAELQPQAITLDVMMPSQDGWEILQRLKSSPDTQHIPVIVCSVLNEPQLALTMGASDYLTKPVSQVELLDVLRRWLGTLRPVA